MRPEGRAAPTATGQPGGNGWRSARSRTATSPRPDSRSRSSSSSPSSGRPAPSRSSNASSPNTKGRSSATPRRRSNASARRPRLATPPEATEMTNDHPTASGRPGAAVARAAGLSTSRAISELRRRSALTWAQLAQLFGVSRQSVLFWVSGRPMNPALERRLMAILEVVRRADSGDTQRNRSRLLDVSHGRSPFDPLAEEEYQEAGARLGRGAVSRPATRRALDASARAERRPLPPQDLIGAMNDRVHRDAGPGRAAPTARNLRREANA